MRMKPITKIFLLCMIMIGLFIGIFLLIGKTYENIENSSNEVAKYNDSIISIKDNFNRYLIYDTNVNIYSIDKPIYIKESNNKLDSLNSYIRSDEIKEIAITKRSNINSLIMKDYKIKESYGEVKYEVNKGVWMFKKTKVKHISYKKIDKSEIEKLNKVELYNKSIIEKFNKSNNIMNTRLNSVVEDRISELQYMKSNIIKTNLEMSKNNFYTLILVTILGFIVIIILLSSIVSDIKSFMKKKDLDKVTLSFLIDFIKKN